MKRFPLVHLKQLRFLLLGFLGAITHVSTALSQSNTSDVPLGGRSTLLGGTGVALGRDGAAPFLNPATMGRILDHRIAFSVHFYRYSMTTIDDLIRAPDSVSSPSLDVSQSSFTSKPATFCAFITLTGLIPEEAQGVWQRVRGHSGRTKLGLCGATLEREQLTLNAEHRVFNDANHHADVAYNLSQSWQRQSIGPSLSYQITEGLTVGTTLQIVTLSSNQSWDYADLVNGTTGHAYLHHLKGSSVDGVTTVGATWTLSPLTFGISARLPSINLNNSARLTQYVSSASLPPKLVSGQGRLVAPLVPTLAFGTGVEWERLSFEFDVSTSFVSYPGIQTTIKTEDSGRRVTDQVQSRDPLRPTVAFRIGSEAHLSTSLSLLAGARYEPSMVQNGFSNPAFRLGPMNRNAVAGSLGLGSYGRGTELVLGIELSHHFGRIPVVSSLNEEAVYEETRFQNTSLLVVLSGSVGLSAVKRTWKNFQELQPKTLLRESR
jgi:hypothetical protein